MNTFGDKFMVNAQVEWQKNGFGLHFAFRQANTGHLYVAPPLTYVQTDDVAATIPPTVFLERSAAQTLIDELWRCGLRPTEGTGSAGAMAAQTRHLEDMRAIAFGQLGGKAVKP